MAACTVISFQSVTASARAGAAPPSSPTNMSPGILLVRFIVRPSGLAMFDFPRRNNGDRAARRNERTRKQCRNSHRNSRVAACDRREVCLRPCPCRSDAARWLARVLPAALRRGVAPAESSARHQGLRPGRLLHAAARHAGRRAIRIRVGRASLAVRERAASRPVQGRPGALRTAVRKLLRRRAGARRSARGQPRVLADHRRQALSVRQVHRPGRSFARTSRPRSNAPNTTACYCPKSRERVRRPRRTVPPCAGLRADSRGPSGSRNLLP